MIQNPQDNTMLATTKAEQTDRYRDVRKRIDRGMPAQAPMIAVEPEPVPALPDPVVLGIRQMGGAVSVRTIVAMTSRHFKVETSAVMSRDRTPRIVHPRQVAMYLSRKILARSLPDIGHRIGGRDHTTVLHAVRKIDAMIDRGEPVADDIVTIAGIIEAARIEATTKPEVEAQAVAA